MEKRKNENLRYRGDNSQIFEAVMDRELKYQIQVFADDRGKCISSAGMSKNN